MINSSKKLKSISGYLPISLWASESHSSHENSTSIAVIGDKNGRIFCTKCFYDKFEISPPTSLFHACEDLLLLLKYEKRNSAIKLLVDNMLEHENGVLLINEISIIKDQSLTDGLISLLITILNKHFSLADNNSRLTVRETILCSIFRMYIIGTNAMISILKFLSTLINDKISVYANFMMEGIIEDNFRLQKLKELVNHLDKKTLQYTIITLIRLLEYKPEFVIQDIINTCELSISKVFLELSDNPTQFKILLDFYLYIFANHKDCFYSLIFHTSRECLFNILNGISNAMVNTKFIEAFNELTDNSYINFLSNNQNNETKDMLNTNSDKVILVIFYNENKEVSQNETCMPNIDECKRSRWLLGTEFGNFLNKFIESIVEILKSSRNIDHKYSALKCILDIFTSPKCIEFFDSNLCYKQNQIMEIYDNISSLKDDPSNIPILKGKNTKRITFKRTRIDDTNQIIKDISNNTTQVKEEYCIHQFFYFKHGSYTIDVLLEILSNEIQNKGVNDKLYANVNLFQINESSENKLRENGYTILNMTMECIYRILRVNVPTHSCPRYLYVLSWFISSLLKKEIRCQPPLPLFGLSSIELIMQTSGAEEPLENALINIIDLFHSDTNNLNKSIPELVIPKNNENIIKLCNYMVKTVKVMSIRLSEMINKSTVNDIDIWRHNSTIHNKIRLIEYFTYVIITISGIIHYKEFNLVDFMYSSNLIFEFYSRQLSSKEQVILDVCQLLIAKSMLEMRKKSNLLDKDEIIQLDNLLYDEDNKINLEYTTNNDLFSLVLKLSNNLKSRLPNEKDQRISNICKSVLKDTESLIYNEEGAKVVFRWFHRPSQINEKDMEMSRMSYKWISNIAKHLLEPLLTEREIQERLQFVTKSKIYASLTLNETVSNDTISIIISLLYFCYIFYPDQIKCFISKYLRESDVKNMNYNCFNFIQNETFNLDGIDGRNIRMLPPRVVMYYSYILTEQSTRQVNFEQNNIIQVTDTHLCENDTNNLTNITNNIEQEILSRLFSILIHSTIRRKEWLTWHSEKFGHCRNFCYSLMNLSLIAENCISNIQNYEIQLSYITNNSIWNIKIITNLKLSCDKKEANISDFCKTNFSIQDEQDIIDEKLVQTSLLLFGIRKSIEINAIKSIINLSELINPFLQLLLDKNSSQLHTVSPKIQIVIINTFLTLMEIICEALDLWLDKCNSNVIKNI
ncbi:hypothetical protein cand_021680 [Cryptosporidium andersoni]|uniref:Uncharacterized protein n=1 Tax=Cryptosporidium andersoni TaxID=117008 RepID=A0A1J4MSH9_9CRYT|nr:hypothetical protein cand_021680 [Cryptosporidium andersoni]